MSLPSTPEGWVARDESILADRDTCAAAEGNDAAQAQASNEPSIYNPFSWLYSLAVEGDKKKQEEWIEAHMNFGNMIQWIEPLLVAVFGSADADAICDSALYTEGSFRNMETGWGLPGTTDVRSFKTQGFGRFVKDNFDWIFPNTTDALPPAYHENLYGCINDGMGADIRTKNLVNEHHLQPGETLPPIEVGRGIELRLFDNFPIEHLPQAYRIVAFVAEAGRHFTAPEYVYNNADWINAVHSVMREGWNAVLPEGYVRAMSAALNLPESFTESLEQNFQAFHVYTEVYHALWDAHSEGMWSVLLVDNLPHEMPPLANPNRDSWELGAINKGLTPDSVFELFGLTLHQDLPRVVQMTDVKLSDDTCGEDLEDLVYLAERFGMVSDIAINREGGVESFTLKHSDDWDRSFSAPPVGMSTLSASL